MPYVTIIIPYKSNLKYLFLALKSVFNQNYKNFKLIIVYDNFYKQDLEKIKKFLKKKNILKDLVLKLLKIKEILGQESQETLQLERVILNI